MAISSCWPRETGSRPTPCSLDSHDLQDRRIAADRRVRARAQGRRMVDGASEQRRRPGGDDLPYVFSGSLVVRGTGIGEVIAIGAQSEIGRIGQSLSTLETEPPRLQAQTRRLVRVFAVVGGRGERPGGAALRHLARRMARRGARRHRARHVDAARRVSGGADGVHGHGRLADLAGARAHAARRRHRDARLGDGAVHGQDRHADREPHVRRRAAAQERRGLPASRRVRRDAARGVPRPGRVRPSRQRDGPLRPHGEGVPRSRSRQLCRGPSTCTAPNGRSCRRTAFAPICSPCRTSGRRPMARQSSSSPPRARRRPSPSLCHLDADGSRRADAVGGRDGRRGPARAGGRPRRRSPEPDGRTRSTISRSSSSGWSALPIRCGRACPMP